ncbi:MAG: DUF952 domain-containing protein [Pseudomonadota bacterium]
MQRDDAETFVYRLASAAEWTATQETGVAPTREIDKRDGYIHLSTRAQVLATANLHFAGARDLFALEIPLAPIADQVKFELAPKRGETFPHLYGALRARHVARAIPLIEGETGFAFGEPA